MSIAAPIKNPSSSFMLPDQTCQRLTLAEIEPATRNFDESLVIGHGGFGKVYKSLTNFGSLNEVAVKRLNSTSSQGADEFEAEVKLLSKLRHGNLVPLIGYCTEGEEMVLAYEFMPNGTLEDHLHRGATGLSWLQRLKICVGAARGLDYLHMGTSTQHGVIHRDVKSSNILLDSNFDGRISDFGLAKVGVLNQTKTHVSTFVKGTFGYMDPYYFYSGKLTRKSDVYAFGVVLLEVLSGKQAVDPTLDVSLADWAKEHIKEGRLGKIVSHTLLGQISKSCLKEFASIAVKCLHNQPKQRPTMAEMVVKLESILSREREAAGPTVDDGRFISKVRYFFKGRTDLIPARAEGTKSSLIPDHVEEAKSNLVTSLVEDTKSNLIPAIVEETNSATSADLVPISNKPSIRTLPYTELLRATKNYNEAKFCIYSLDTIYKGWVDESTYAQVESGVYVRTKPIGTSKLKFKPEEFKHPNLVKLLGYCLKRRQLSCVYEQIHETSLDELLYGGKSTLSWVARLKIAIGAADGLCFLHKKGHPAYSQFKTSCILVDKDYNARLRDFEVETSFVALDLYLFEDDAYYAAPEWFRYQADVKLEGTLVEHQCEVGFGVKSELFSFGVVLLEILSGMKVFDRNRPDGKQNLVEWATPLLPRMVNLGKIVDPQLLDDDNNPPKGAFILAKLVSNCLRPRQDTRPSMEEILWVLRQCYREIVS